MTEELVKEIVLTLQALRKWLEAQTEVTSKAEDVVAELSELCREGGRGHAHQDELTLFKSVGASLEDLATAELVLSNRNLPERT